MIAYIYPAFWIFSHQHNNINHANTFSVLDFRTAHSAVHDHAAPYLYTSHSAHAFRIRINIRIGYTLSAWKQELQPGCWAGLRDKQVLLELRRNGLGQIGNGRQYTNYDFTSDLGRGWAFVYRMNKPWLLED